MPPFTVVFLGSGTSSGVPMIGCHCQVCSSANPKDQRLRSSILIKTEITTLLIDATPDFRQQMLREKVDRLDAVLLTHPHKDHLGGLDDTRAFQFIYQKATPVYGNSLTLMGVKAEIPYAFAEHKYPGLPIIDLHLIDLNPFTIGDIDITPVLVWHFNMPVYGFRIGDFVYITDANRIDEAEKEKIQNCDTLVLNALRHQKHISHFSLSEAKSLAQELGVKNALFTHISHQLGLHDKINEELPTNMQLAYDGLRLQF